MLSKQRDITEESPDYLKCFIKVKTGMCKIVQKF